MSGSLNKAMLIGNLGRDPEVRAVSSGVKVANFTLATNESYTDRNGQKVDKTEWHRVVMWRGLADIAERFLSKGSTVYVEGKLTTRSWEGQDGQKRYTTEIVCDNMQMLGGRGQGGGDYSRDNSDSQDMPYSQSVSSDSGGSRMDGPPSPEDDLPF